ncbi:MAG: AMP-binding protein [Lacibacter sp.]
MPSSPLNEFLRNVQQIPNDVFLRQPFNGQWKEWTWKQADDECRRVASAIKLLGLAEKTHIAVLSKNCAHWIMADIAIMMAGCVSIPIYPTLTAHAIQPILEHSDAKAIFIGKLDDFSTQEESIPVNFIRIGFDDYERKEQYNWNELIAQHQPLQEVHHWTADEILTIIYTSGTTGNPKGVIHTAGNFDAVLTIAIKELKLPKRSAMFSYLPLSHIAERTGIEFDGLYSGSTISFSESIQTFAKNVEEIQPHVFFAVPRLWGKFREGILHKIPQNKLSILLAIPFVNTFIKKSIRKKLGLSRASHIYSAAAPISVDMLQWYDKLGVTIIQALGMTEDCVYAHFERPYAYRHGSVGKPFEGLHVKISEEGELRVKSPSIMKGYYKEAEMTAEVFDEDGYLKTGDLCEYDHDGFLFVTGRVKDQFKTDKGKYISPAPIELKLLANTDIENVCVVGMGIPQPIALVTLSEAGKQKTKEQIVESITISLNNVNPSLEHYEWVEKAIIMKENWSVENGLLTPTLKVKRNQVEKLHQPFYTTWFDHHETVFWE